MGADDPVRLGPYVLRDGKGKVVARHDDPAHLGDRADRGEGVRVEDARGSIVYVPAAVASPGPPLRHISNRELWARMYHSRSEGSKTPEADALHVEWTRRLYALRGRFKKGRLSGRRERAMARFINETYAYFDGSADRDRLWCERARELGERVERAEVEHAELRATLERLRPAIDALAKVVDETEFLSEAANPSAAERARRAWGGDKGGRP